MASDQVEVLICRGPLCYTCVTMRRSEKNRVDKYSERAGALLDQFHFNEPERLFLYLMESKDLTIDDLREMTWAQVKDSYDGILIQGKPVNLRPEAVEQIRGCLQSLKGCYGEALDSSDGSPKLISKETMKSISKELDQFKG